MTPHQVHAAMAEMQRFIREQLGPREFHSLTTAEVAAIHDAADAYVLTRYGVRGWDLAALAAASLPQPSGPDFDVWKQLYCDLEELAEREAFHGYYVYGDYAEDRTAVVNCTSDAEPRAREAIRALLRNNPAYAEFAVLLVPTTEDGKQNVSSGRTLRAQDSTP